jgi:hypothetical protein
MRLEGTFPSYRVKHYQCDSNGTTCTEGTPRVPERKPTLAIARSVTVRRTPQLVSLGTHSHC